MKSFIYFLCLAVVSAGTLYAEAMLPAPSAPVANSPITIGSMYFMASWNSSSGATSYYIDVSTSSIFTTFVSGFNNRLVSSISGSTSTSATISGGISEGNIYYYRVRAANASGTSGNSNVITVTMLPAAPVALEETNVTATTFQANWNAASGATSYTIQYSVSSGFSPVYNTQNTTSTSISGLTFPSGTIYYYRVRSSNSAGTSGWSSVITAGTTPVVPVATAATLLATNSFKANWNAASGATGYALDVATTSNFTTGTFVSGYQNVTVSTIAGYTSTSVPVSVNINAGQTYYYRLRALGGNGPSGNSNVINAVTLPATPVATAATDINATQFTANWNSTAGANNYRIDVSTSATFTTFVLNNQNVPSGISYVVTGLTQGQVYYYRVRAQNNSGTSDNSNIISCTPVLAAPMATNTSNVTVSSFYVNWNAVPGATGYVFDLSATSNFSTFIYQNQTTSGGSGFTGNPNGSLNIYANVDPLNNSYYYRVRAVNANGMSSYSNVITVLQFPPVPVATPPTNVSTNQFTATWNTVALASEYRIDIARDLNFNDLVSGYTDLAVTGATSVTMSTGQGQVYYYRVRARNTSGTSANSNVVRVLTNNSYNLIRKTVVTAPGLFTDLEYVNAPNNTKALTSVYFDGMGRAVQTVMRQQSPSQHDIVQPLSYDGFGREARKYLPYASAENTGDYQNTAIRPYDYLQSDQYLFYQNTPGVASDTRPFSETVFESSMLSRPQKNYGEGAVWGPANQNKFNGFAYLNNTHSMSASSSAERIIAWEVSGGVPARKAPLTDFVETGGYVASRQLSITQTTDEHGNVVREYTNKQGQVILKKVQAGSSASNLNSTTDWALTYYVYDIYGNLRFVLPPELSKKIHEAPDSSPVDPTSLLNLAFVYTYDALNRMAIKQVPGAGPVYMVYDKRDRLVLTQDAVQRQSNQWTFTKYDVMNRPILTGIKDTTATVLQSAMQGVVDTYYDLTKPWRTFGETFTGSGPVHGYTNNSYPRTTSSGTLDVNRYLTVTFYDAYYFKTSWGPAYTYVNDALTRTINGSNYTQPGAAETVNLKGLVTGTKIKVLDGGVTGGQSWLKAVNYYDEDYRLIQTISDNYKQGTDRVSTLYDFTGKVLQSKSTHEEYDMVWKDMTSGVVKIGERLYRSAGGSDNNQGAASVAILPANTDGWFEFTHSNANNLYIGFSAANTSTAYSSIEYCLGVGGTTYTARKSGGTATNIGAHALGDVFRIERVSGTVRILKNGTLTYTFPGSINTALLVDVSFYSGQSSVLNARSSFSASSHVTVRAYDYDHAGRLLSTWHKLDNGTDILLSKNEYNELGQLIDKKLHSTQSNGSDAKQSIDYAYNIRGWLSKVNDAALSDNSESNHDLFGFELGYHEDLGISNPALYNGNISAVKWSNNLGLGTIKENAYVYSYDAMNRILSSTFNEKATTWTPLADSRNAESGFAYDLNGNITSLKRNDKRTSGLKMDDLVYEYGAGTAQSNKLLKVTDNGDDYEGFIDGTNGGNDYNYDANGNMTLDLNKGISTDITYNLLNLPEVVTRGTGNSIRYIYDATGRKLAQVVNYATVYKQTDYAGEYQYENDVLQHVAHEEGRIVMANTETVYTHNADATTGMTANVSTLAAITQNGSTYVRAIANGTTGKQGIFPIGGTFAVQAGEVYRIRAKGYRAVTSNNVFLNIRINGTDVSWPGTQLAPSPETEAWVEQAVTIPPGGTSMEAGVIWNTTANSQAFFLNDFEIVKISSTSPEYQYNLKDHLGNVRVSFTTKHAADTATATMETANISEEQGEFLYYDEAVKINSALFDHTNSSSTHYATRLTGSSNERYGLAKSMSVMPGDTVRATVYAKYLDTNNGNWTTALNNLMTAIANGTAPVGTLVDGGMTGSTGGATPPHAGMISKGSETGTAPKAYLNFLVFNKDMTTVLDGGFVRLTEAGREYGQNGAHEELFKELIITEPGYVYLYLSNDNYALGGPMMEVYFDDFAVTHTKSPVIQTDDYYAFGLSFNSYSRENSTANQYLYNDKEKQDELDLGWMDYGARMYMPEIGRWGTVDPLSDAYVMMSPFSYAINNPIVFIDPDGMDVVFYDENGRVILRIESKKLNQTFVATGQKKKKGRVEWNTFAEAEMPGIIEGYEGTKYQDYDHEIAAQTYLFNHLKDKELPANTNGEQNDDDRPSDLNPTLVKAIILQETGVGTFNGNNGQNGKSDIMQANVTTNNGETDWSDSKAKFGLEKGKSATPSQSIYAGIRILYQKGLTTQNGSTKWTGGSDWFKAVERYNGGGTPGYADKVKKYYNSAVKGQPSNYQSKPGIINYLNNLNK